MDVLTDMDRRILDFERQWWRRAGAREQAIRDTFDLSPTLYWMRLHRLIHSRAAAMAEPQLVSRLLREQDRQLRLRAPRSA